MSQSEAVNFIEPSAEFVKQATISGMDAYKALCAEAEKDYEGFWARLAREHVAWKKPFTQVLDESNAPFFKWFADGTLNASYNCLDRNIEAGLGDKVAILFEADDGEVKRITYKQLLAQVSQFANGLRARGIKKGDRVVIYMSMGIEGIVAMQACARIGAIHSVVFGGFSAQSVRDRINDATDFVGWYMNETRNRNGIALTDARNQYLAYHEGHTGFARGSYNQKSWLLRVADDVQKRANMYEVQLNSCRRLW